MAPASVEVKPRTPPFSFFIVLPLRLHHLLPILADVGSHRACAVRAHPSLSSHAACSILASVQVSRGSPVSSRLSSIHCRFHSFVINTLGHPTIHDISILSSGSPPPSIFSSSPHPRLERHRIVSIAFVHRPRHSRPLLYIHASSRAPAMYLVDSVCPTTDPRAAPRTSPRQSESTCTRPRTVRTHARVAVLLDDTASAPCAAVYRSPVPPYP